MVISATSRAAAKILAIAKRKARRKVRESTPEAKARRKVLRSRPENKAKQKVSKAKHYSTPEAMAKRATPEYKAKAKAHKDKPENKAIVRQHQVIAVRWQRPEVKARVKARQSTPEYKAKYKAYRQRPEVKARLSYLQIPQVRLKRKLTRQKLGYALNVNLKIVDHKTGTLKKQLTREERKKLGWVGNFFAPGVAVGGVGLYGVSNKRGRR